MKPTVWITPLALDVILTECTRTAPKETGGVFMGYGDPLHGFIIAKAVGPGPEAVHDLHRFVPDHTYHEQEVARLYEASGRTETYLGDWHSHPTAAAYLSPRDRATLRSIARDRAARAPYPLMMVVGGYPEGIGVWFLPHHPVHWFRRPRPCDLARYDGSEQSVEAFSLRRIKWKRISRR